MAGQLERILQAMLKTPTQLATSLVSLLLAPADNLGAITDSVTTRANGSTRMVWDAAANAGGKWDDYCWDAAPAALSVGGLIWDHAGAIGQWDQGAVWR